MVILKYKEWLLVAPKEKMWTYELCQEMPVWDEKKQDYLTRRKPRTLDPREAKKLIEEHSLKCVHKNKYGEIYI